MKTQLVGSVLTPSSTFAKESEIMLRTRFFWFCVLAVLLLSLPTAAQATTIAYDAYNDFSTTVNTDDLDLVVSARRQRQHSGVRRGRTDAALDVQRSLQPATTSSGRTTTPGTPAPAIGRASAENTGAGTDVLSAPSMFRRACCGPSPWIDAPGFGRHVGGQLAGASAGTVSATMCG